MTFYTSQALPVGYELGQYRIIRVLHEDANCVTYLAEDTALGCMVEIEELLPMEFVFRSVSDSVQVVEKRETPGGVPFEELKQDFLQGAGLRAAPAHPNIAKVLTTFEALGTAYCVSTHAEGVYVDSYLRVHGRPSEEKLRALLLPLLSALDCLHAQGECCERITSADILLTEAGEPLLVRIEKTRLLIRRKALVGAPPSAFDPYALLPEHEQTGPWSDIYTLAVVAYDLLSRKVLPKGAERLQGDDPYVPLATQPELQEAYSHRLLESIDRALAVQPGERWSAAEWAQALAEPCAVPGTSAAPAASPSARSHPLLRAAVYTLPFLAGLGIGLTAEDACALVKEWSRPRPVAPVPKTPAQPVVEVKRPLFSIPHVAAVKHVYISPDGRTVATVDADCAVRLWNVETREQIGLAEQHGAEVSAASFSPDGKHFLSASKDETLRILDVDKGGPARVLLKVQGVIDGLVFCPGNTFVARFRSSQLCLGYTTSGVAIGKALQLPHGWRGTSEQRKKLFLTPDGSKLLVWNDSSEIYVLDPSPLNGGLHANVETREGRRQKEYIPSIVPSGVVWDVDMSPDGRRVAVCSGSTVSLWDVETRKPQGAEMWHKGEVGHALFSPDGNTLATRTRENVIRFWDLESRQPRGEAAHAKQYSPYVGTKEMAFSADGSRLLFSACPDYGKTSVYLLDAATGVQIGPERKQEPEALTYRFSPDGRFFVTLPSEDTILLWNARTGQLAGSSLRHEGKVHAIAFSPDGKTLIAGYGKGLHFWELPQAEGQGAQPAEASSSPQSSETSSSMGGK